STASSPRLYGCLSRWKQKCVLVLDNQTRLPHRTRVDNAGIAQKFRDVADLLNLKGENFFRVRAYQAGAETVANLPQEASTYIAEGADLTQFEGIGKELALKIVELVETNRLEFLEKLGR